MLMIANVERETAMEKDEMAMSGEAILKEHTPEELEENKAESERIRIEQRKSMVKTVCIFVVVLSLLFSLDFRTSPPGVQPMVLLFGVGVASLMYVAAVWASEARKRAEDVSLPTLAILHSMNDNLAGLGQLEERLAQIELRLRRLEESKMPPPPPR